MTTEELMKTIESLVNDTSDAAAIAMAKALAQLERAVSFHEYIAFCDRVFGNWG